MRTIEETVGARHANERAKRAEKEAAVRRFEESLKGRENNYEPYSPKTPQGSIDADGRQIGLIAHELKFRVLYAWVVPIYDIDLPNTTTQPRAKALLRIAEQCEQRGLSARVYVTRAGLRVIVTNVSMVAGGEDSVHLMAKLECDARYAALCVVEDSFAARLDPKAERVIPGTRHGVCAFLCAFGNGTVTSKAARIIEIHDRETKAMEGLPLA